jgi:hypothetical protein
MRKRYKNGLLVPAITTAALMVGVNAFAAHPSVPLRDAAGAIIAASTTAYSPKTTCGACHTRGVNADGSVSLSGPVGSYDGGVGGVEGEKKTIVKTQGIMNETTGEVEWVTYTVEDYKHGFVTGRHSQQGRNEDYGNHLRHAVGGKFWESSPGMFGKY